MLFGWKTWETRFFDFYLIFQSVHTLLLNVLTFAWYPISTTWNMPCRPAPEVRVCEAWKMKPNMYGRSSSIDYC
jgi:hypothetical protein